MSGLRPHPHPLLTKKLRDKTEGIVYQPKVVTVLN